MLDDFIDVIYADEFYADEFYADESYANIICACDENGVYLLVLQLVLVLLVAPILLVVRRQVPQLVRPDESE
jgi:hypothetical protein